MRETAFTLAFSGFRDFATVSGKRMAQGQNGKTVPGLSHDRLPTVPDLFKFWHLLKQPHYFT
jgi:hypothetical protein